MTRRHTTRRAFLSSLFVPLRAAASPASHDSSEPPSRPPPIDSQSVAIVQGRFCLAYQGSFCSTCVERCPVPSAITTERGLPRIDPDACTGCGICQTVCPAPRNAILLTTRRVPQPGAPTS